MTDDIIEPILSQIRDSLKELLTGKHRVDGLVGNSRVSAYWVAQNPLRIDIHGLNTFAPPTVSEETMGLMLAEMFEPGEVFHQYPIGHYFADYYIVPANVVIEVDGSYHRNREAIDAKRDKYMTDLGIRVMRFTDKEVIKNRSVCIARIRSLTLAN